MSGTFTDVSWPDEPGLWTGMDGVVYDVEISTEQDEVRVALITDGLYFCWLKMSHRPTTIVVITW